jgi:predicted RNA-binding protein YlxR (DUF448 family)
MVFNLALSVRFDYYLLQTIALSRCYKRGAYVMENRLAAQALTATNLMMRRFISHITANNTKNTYLTNIRPIIMAILFYH